MGIIKDKFKEKSDIVAGEIKALLKEHGNKKIGEVTLSQIYQGMRGITGLVSETSLLDAQEGIRFRGYTIPELQQKLPKAPNGSEPLPEGLFHLMLVGELPSEDDVHHITNVLQRRSHVPNHVFDTIEALPVSAHPMTQFVVGIMALQTESQFSKNYAAGMNKKDYWTAVFDDSMDLIARLPRVAAYIYRRKYKNGEHIQPNGLLDWAGNFAHMMGFEDESFKELMRLYMTIHADHEGGNVSAHTTHLVGSALSDPYLSFAAGMNGLAGPLHGLANQEVIKWIYELRE
ncbi:MAG: citrate (Si)-synthase, partial [Ferruginibacter sp.]